MQDFKNLKVWRKSHELTLEVYRATKRFPDYERFGLARQVRNAATSIPSNIAEGSSRRTDFDFRRFLFMALGSLSELEYQLILAKDLSFLNNADFEALKSRIVEIRRMMWPFVGRLPERATR